MSEQSTVYLVYVRNHDRQVEIKPIEIGAESSIEVGPIKVLSAERCVNGQVEVTLLDNGARLAELTTEAESTFTMHLDDEYGDAFFRLGLFSSREKADSWSKQQAA